MEFLLTTDQEALVEATRRLLAGRFPMSHVRSLEDRGGMDRQGWATLAEAGVFALRLAESRGGVGLGMAEAVLVFEELGRALVPGPLVSTHLAADLIAGAPSGERTVGVLDQRALPLLIEHGATVDTVIVVDDDGLWEVDPGAVMGEAVVPLDPLTPLNRVAARVLDGSPRRPRGTPGDAVRWRREAAVLTSALQLGIAEAVTDAGVAYAKQRVQFDKPIGAFQAVKHILADMLVRTEVARAAVYAAGVTLDDPYVGDPDRAAAGAKLLAGEAALANAKACVQVHGGMGFTWEVDAHLYLKRAWVLETAWGSGDDHAERIAVTL